MKVIKLDYPHTYTKDDFPPLSIALGFFDGVHKGHQTVISSAIETAKANGWSSAVMTFYPHPLAVLRSRQDVHYITPIEDKMALIEQLGVDYLFVANFTEAFASLLPQQFVDEYLLALNVKHVTAGFDYSYGRLGKGTMETLPFHARGIFTQTIVPKLSFAEEKISSTRIRSLLFEGDFEGFHRLAGRNYATKGVVIHGEKRGRKLGFPTANVHLSDEYIIPSTGVYAVKATVNNRTYDGVCNIGYKPTFHDEKPDRPNVEVHIFDFEDTIYDHEITVEWFIRLRSEKKFAGLDELIAQISQDKSDAKQYFEKITR
ncbi:bifunctional riboflavin kinase/FAD synthetase [Bacillus massiliigorillae]|uniref:bifunctional riboflavin kinase/FAD synthetase n=1 Tax=Bacillus massiliigorillae TaxID=1243664 RepID=UPI00039CE7B0|nr:bifunctional riboflavin kinase/FAD synthetase [Bacillus massiliigorillae]